MNPKRKAKNPKKKQFLPKYEDLHVLQEDFKTAYHIVHGAKEDSQELTFRFNNRHERREVGTKKRGIVRREMVRWELEAYRDSLEHIRIALDRFKQWYDLFNNKPAKVLNTPWLKTLMEAHDESHKTKTEE